MLKHREGQGYGYREEEGENGQSSELSFVVSRPNIVRVWSRVMEPIRLEKDIYTCRSTGIHNKCSGTHEDNSLGHRIDPKSARRPPRD
jgi:hypothetical protein